MASIGFSRSVFVRHLDGGTCAGLAATMLETLSMAVYTDVAAEDLAPLPRRLRHRRAHRVQGNRRGRRELELFGPHRPRLFHSDAVRAARGRTRPAVLSGAHGASGEPRHHLPAAGQEPRRRDAGPARRPAGGDRHLSRGHVDPPPERRALRGAGRGAGAAASRRRGLRRCSARTRCRSPAGGSFMRVCHDRANEVQRDLDGARRASSQRSKRMAARTCRRALSTPTCSPTTSSFSAINCRG